jgi:hypothetical protein
MLYGGLPDRLDGHRLRPGWWVPVSRPQVCGWLVGSSTPAGLARGLGSCEEFVHDLRAGGNDGSQFAAVDDLGCAGRGVPDEAGDLLDADAAVAHQVDERGPQLPWRPDAPMLASSQTRLNSFRTFPASSAAPRWVVNASPMSCQSSPAASRSPAWLSDKERSARTAVTGRPRVRRDRRKPGPVELGGSQPPAGLHPAPGGGQ